MSRFCDPVQNDFVLENDSILHMSLRDFADAEKRRIFLENELQMQLPAIKDSFSDNEADIHCENLIGAVSLPLGIAGPLLVKGECADGQYYIPLATTEGALVASVARGCKALSLSQGAQVYTHRVGTTRGPVFFVGNLQEQKKLHQWLVKHERILKQTAEQTSRHLIFLKMDIRLLVNYVFVRFYFDTDNAMGMNMATIATQAMVEVIKKETGVSCLSVAGNFDIDKKPAWLNSINGRGCTVWAEAVIEKKIIADVLKTSAQKLYDVWLGKCVFGSMMSGSLGFNAHFANIVAAFFAATGQDLAHVVEGSMGITAIRIVDDGGLHISVYLPAVMVGTVGGGTKLKTQQEALRILGISDSEELAEVLGGAVLAGELSLLASQAEGTLARAHERLGR